MTIIKTRVWDAFNECFWFSDKFESKVKFYTAIAELQDAGNKLELEQLFTGLHDKNGVEIYEGDRIQYREPYRTTQTHTGNNIPNGSYTEPMEPGIRTHTGIVIYKEGMFQFQDDDNDTEFPLIFCITDWDLDSIETAISYNRPDRFIFNDPEEGDLQYLITECAKVETSEQLIEYLNGVEVIGNIYQNENLIK